MEGGAARQAAGNPPEGHRQATGYFQKHGQEVNRLAGSAHQPESQTGFFICTSQLCKRTFSLDSDLMREVARSLAGKPLAGFRATPSRRNPVLYGMVVYAIRFKNPLLHRQSTLRKRRLGENRVSGQTSSKATPLVELAYYGVPDTSSVRFAYI